MFSPSTMSGVVSPSLALGPKFLCQEDAPPHPPRKDCPNWPCLGCFGGSSPPVPSWPFAWAKNGDLFPFFFAVFCLSALATLSHPFGHTDTYTFLPPLSSFNTFWFLSSSRSSFPPIFFPLSLLVFHHYLIPFLSIQITRIFWSLRARIRKHFPFLCYWIQKQIKKENIKTDNEILEKQKMSVILFLNLAHLALCIFIKKK